MPEQEERLQSEALAAGVSVSRLLLERALAGDGWTATEKRAVVSELLGAVNQVMRVGTNVNQIARWANAEQKFQHEAYRLVTLIEDAVAQLGAAVEAVQRT
jgi:hypothetical protein